MENKKEIKQKELEKVEGGIGGSPEIDNNNILTPINTLSDPENILQDTQTKEIIDKFNNKIKK